MRAGMITVATATAVLLAAEPARADDGLVATFAKLQRGTRWERTAAVPVGFPTHHPQGLAAVGDELFVSSVQIDEPTKRFDQPQGGYDRTPGKGRGHLFKMSRDGRLLAQVELGEGDIYHPGGIDYDGRWLWVPVGEYRPNSASIVYRVDPATLAAEAVLRVPDHVGGIVRDPETNRLHGVSWGSRRFYTWQLDDGGRPASAEGTRTLNPSHYVDYQDCAYVGGRQALCSGVSEYRPDPAKPKWALGGLDLVDLNAGRTVHQVPVML